MGAIIDSMKSGSDYFYPKTKTSAVYDDSNNRLDNTLTSINDSLNAKVGKWQVLKSAYDITGNTTVTIPSGTEELFVYCHNIYATQIIPTAMLNATTQYFNNGYYASSGNNGNMVINATNSAIVLRLPNYNGAQLTTAKYTVLYR